MFLGSLLATLLVERGDLDGALAARCDLDVSAAILKGRNNYLCLARAAEFARHPTFAVRDEAGHPVAIQGVARDVTERMRAQEAERLARGFARTAGLPYAPMLRRTRHQRRK